MHEIRENSPVCASAFRRTHVPSHNVTRTDGATWYYRCYRSNNWRSVDDGVQLRSLWLDFDLRLLPQLLFTLCAY